MRADRLWLVAVMLTLAVGCGSKAPPDELGGSHESLAAKVKAGLTVTLTTTETATATRTETDTETATTSGTATAPTVVTVTQTTTSTQTSTYTQSTTSTHTRTATGSTTTHTATAFNLPVSSTAAGTMTGINDWVASRTYLWTATLTRVATLPTTFNGTGTATGTFADNGVTYSHSGTTTATMQFTGFVTATKTQTVAAYYSGAVSKTASTTGTGVGWNGRLTWSYTKTTTGSHTEPYTQTDTQTLTQTMFPTATHTATGTGTRTVTQPRTVTNTVTETITETVTNTVTGTATGTGTSVDGGTGTDGGVATCLQDWRNTVCGESCTRETQWDRMQCRVFLDCYVEHDVGPTSDPEGTCGVNRCGYGMAPKLIADQVVACLGCTGSAPVSSCIGVPDGTACTDENPCTRDDRCQGGVCVGVPVVCRVDLCHTPGTCDRTTGACLGGAPIACLALDQCHLAGTCNPVTGVCSNPVKANGSPCNDRDACTGPDTCASGTCVGGTSVTCPQSENFCLETFCESVTGSCLSVPANGRACDDGDPSTTDDLCFAGVCASMPTDEECGATLSYLEKLRDDPAFAARALEAEKKIQEYVYANSLDPDPVMAVVPIVVHNLYNPGLSAGPVGYLTPEQIKSQIAALNDYYGGGQNSRAVDPTGDSFLASVIGTARIKFALARRTPDCKPTDGIQYLTSAALRYSVYFNTLEMMHGGTPVALNADGSAQMAADHLPIPAENQVPLQISSGRVVTNGEHVPVLTDGTPAANMTWRTQEYLNYWIGNAYDVSGLTTDILDPYYCLGYQGSTLAPTADNPPDWEFEGIFGNYQNFGTVSGATPPAKYLGGKCGSMTGEVAAHEIGHYLGLFHTFDTRGMSSGGMCGGSDMTDGARTNPAANADCHKYGDAVCDTPPIKNGGGFCPGDAGPIPDTCPETPSRSDLVSLYNLMSYNDECRFVFTAEQVVRMQAVLHRLRAGLLSSPAWLPPPGPGEPDPDLYFADTPEDSGIEPNPTTEPMWVTDDIWVRNQDNNLNFTEHQNPVYGQENYVYVRVRNRGCKNYVATENNYRVRLYWAKASTALGWPVPWNATPPAGMDPSVEWGGPLGELPIEDIYMQNPPEGHNAGEALLKFPWTPPDRAQYEPSGAADNHFCLLARLVDPSAPNEGMRQPETVGGGDALYANVQNSRRIIWKNVEIASEAAPDADVVLSWTTARPNPDASYATLTFKTPESAFPGTSLFSNWGSARVVLGPTLYYRWIQANPHADGALSHCIPYSVPLTGNNQSIHGLPIYPGESHTIAVRFEPKAGSMPGKRRLPEAYDLDVIQTAPNGTRIGGQRLKVKTRIGL